MNGPFSAYSRPLVQSAITLKQHPSPVSPNGAQPSGMLRPTLFSFQKGAGLKKAGPFLTPALAPAPLRRSGQHGLTARRGMFLEGYGFGIGQLHSSLAMIRFMDGRSCAVCSGERLLATTLPFRHAIHGSAANECRRSAAPTTQLQETRAPCPSSFPICRTPTTRWRRICRSKPCSFTTISTIRPTSITAIS